MGMGEATVRLFARAGARVVLADVNEAASRRVVDEIVKGGGEAMFHQTNVAIAAQVEALVAATVARYGRLDVAVNNAAVTPDVKPLAELDEADFDRVIAVDLKGVALCLKFELAQMLRQGQGGSIINIASVSGFRPQPNNAAYVAAKHGVIGLTKVAALENGAYNIRVNAVAPGAIDTPMLRGALDAMQRTEAEIAPSLSLLNRFGTPQEVAESSLWLASELSSYVTGSTLHVDAGYVGR